MFKELNLFSHLLNGQPFSGLLASDIVTFIARQVPRSVNYDFFLPYMEWLFLSGKGIHSMRTVVCVCVCVQDGW